MDTCILELGVRTLRLLGSRAAERGPVEVVDIHSERVRLGESIDRTGTVTASVSSDLLAAVSRLLEVAHSRCPGVSLHAIAPHALGGSENARSVLAAIGRRTGVAVTLLSPRDTARLAYRAARSELGYLGGQTAVVHLGDAAADFTSGTRATLDVADTLPLGVGRLHRAFGSGDSGLAAVDASALSSLVRLCAGPATRRLREWGVPVLVVTSENAATVREVGRAWGFLGEDSETIGRVALRALATEILQASVWDLENLGIDPRRAALVGTTAITIDTLTDLLGQREVLLAASGPSEGAALEILRRPALKLASGA
jgi:exopolyphosphatase / guanosine-5'-triphosphate,3'-diphosphate pyrophosphatase